MNDGHTVVAVDGLKIEPLPEDISGVNPFGERFPFRPLRDVTEIYERLNERIMAGFPHRPAGAAGHQARQPHFAITIRNQDGWPASGTIRRSSAATTLF